MILRRFILAALRLRVRTHERTTTGFRLLRAAQQFETVTAPPRQILRLDSHHAADIRQVENAKQPGFTFGDLKAIFR